MRTLEMNQMEEIEGGGHECAGAAAAVAATALGIALTGPAGWLGAAFIIASGAYEGHVLYHACFE